MHYSLILVAAFATASIATPAACPPASTQGKEDAAKDVGKLAEEACPRSQILYLDGYKPYPLLQDQCKPLADKCLQGGITEPAKLKQCISDASASGIEINDILAQACPSSQVLKFDGLAHVLSQDKCKPLADKCLQGGITKPATLTQCITDALASELDKNAAQGTEKPAKVSGELAEKARPPSQTTSSTVTEKPAKAA